MFCFLIRPCERRNIPTFVFFAKFKTRNIPTFVFLQNSKHEIFHINGINRIKIKFLFSQKTCSDSNFNQTFDYNYGMQGLTFWGYFSLLFLIEFMLFLLKNHRSERILPNIVFTHFPIFVDYQKNIQLSISWNGQA